ncbi:hypothetical protein L9F63_011941, partial [Diploptera punctata]
FSLWSVSEDVHPSKDDRGHPRLKLKEHICLVYLSEGPWQRCVSEFALPQEVVKGGIPAPETKFPCQSQLPLPFFC